LNRRSYGIEGEMRAATSYLILMGTWAVIVYGAQAPPPATGAGATQENPPAAVSAASHSSSASQQTRSTALQVTVAKPQVTFAKPQITFAAPRAAPQAPQTASTTALASQIADRGYQRVMIHGQVRFCRIETKLGSHVQTQQACLTKAQMEAEQQGAQRMIENLGRASAAGTQVPYILGGPLGGH
jgi:hypothetical protein